MISSKKTPCSEVPKQAVTCLTEYEIRGIYSVSTTWKTVDGSMSKKLPIIESPIEALKSESARARWELFHRAIAHAKESNNASLDDSDAQSRDPDVAEPLLTIVR